MEPSGDLDLESGQFHFGHGTLTKVSQSTIHYNSVVPNIEKSKQHNQKLKYIYIYIYIFLICYINIDTENGHN